MNQQYYKSHLKLDFIAITGQQALNRSKVLVIGAGGLGCPCLTALASSGIGHIGIVDGDIISTSNISRQTLFKYTDIGKSKTTSAIHALRARNPYLLYQDHHVFVYEENILQLIEAYEVIVDATDNFEARYLINDACILKDKPLVYGAIFQNEGHLTVFNYKNSPTLRCLFPKPDQDADIPSCSDTGSYMIATNIIGTMMANEVIKIILNHEDVLSGKLLSFEALNNQTRLTTYNTDMLSKNKSHSRFKTVQKAIELTAEVFIKKVQTMEVELIDVRTNAERAERHIGGKHIPLSDLSALNLSRFPLTQHFYIYCQTGARSLQAAKWLRANGYKNAFSLKNGITNLNYQFQTS